MDDAPLNFIMEDAMSDIVNEWLSVEAAAIRLGISSRSIARRVQSGQLESRVDANGRRSVLVTVPAAASASSAKTAAEPQVIPAEVTAALSAVDQTAQETGQTRAIVQQAMSVVIRSHEETVYAAREDAFSARRSMRRAWAAVALLFIAAAATVGIVTHNLTAATDRVHQADQRADKAERLARNVAVQRDQLQEELTQAKVQTASAQGQLRGQLTAITAAYTQKPTTAPSTAQKVASLFFGD